MAIKRVILDTNFLLIPIRHKVDIFSEIDRLITGSYELYIIDKTIDELKKITQTGSGKDKTAAKIAIQLIAKKGINLIKGDKNLVDDDILELSRDESTVVATQDGELKRRINKPIIVLRQKNHLELI